MEGLTLGTSALTCQNTVLIEAVSENIGTPWIPESIVPKNTIDAFQILFIQV